MTRCSSARSTSAPAIARRYLEHLDLVFAFELLFSPWEERRLRAAIGPAAELGRVAWVLSNHDFERLASRVGEENVRAAALLLLTLPGRRSSTRATRSGSADGPGSDPPYDRAGRDPLRHPMQWDGRRREDSDRPPWLSPIDPAQRSVGAQRGDPGSLLELYRRLIALRPELGSGFRLIEAEPGVVAYERGQHTVDDQHDVRAARGTRGEVVLATHVAPGLPPHAGVIVRN